MESCEIKKNEKVNSAVQANFEDCYFSQSPIKRYASHFNKIRIHTKQTKSIDTDLVFSNQYPGMTKKKLLYDKIFRNNLSSESRYNRKIINKFNYQDTILKPANRLKAEFSRAPSDYLQKLKNIRNSYKQILVAGESIHELPDVIATKPITASVKKPKFFEKLVHINKRIKVHSWNSYDKKAEINGMKTNKKIF